VASLIVKTVLVADDIVGDFRKLGLYVLTIMAGLFMCSFIFMPLAYFIIRRTNPFKFVFSIIQPIMIAFATAST